MPTPLVTYAVRLVGYAQAESDAARRRLTKLVNAHDPRHVAAYAGRAKWAVEPPLHYYRGTARTIADGVDVELDETGGVLVGDPVADRYWLRQATSKDVEQLTSLAAAGKLRVLMDEQAGGPVACLKSEYADEVLAELTEPEVEPPQPTPAVPGDLVAALLDSVAARTAMTPSAQAAYLATRGWTQGDTFLTYKHPDEPTEGTAAECCQRQLDRDRALVDAVLKKEVQTQ